MGEEFTAKDLRTWNATVFAALQLMFEAHSGETPSSRQLNGAFDKTAEELGNTRAVVRSSYIDPRVTEAFEDGEVIEWSEPSAWKDIRGDDDCRGRLDHAVARLIDERSD